VRLVGYLKSKNMFDTIPLNALHTFLALCLDSRIRKAIGVQFRSHIK